jgi:hypothetical protein
MIVIKLTPDLKTMLEQYKERTGSSYANTVRTALFAHFEKEAGRISPRPAPYPKAAAPVKVDADPAGRASEARDTIRQHFRQLLERLRTEHGGEYAPVRAAIEAEVSAFGNKQFELAGYPPTLNTVLELIVLDERSTDTLRDYARGVLSPLTRTRGKKRDKAIPAGGNK